MQGASESVVNVGLTSTTVIGPSATRIGLMFTSPPTNRITLTTVGAAVLDQGLTLNPGQGPVTLNYAWHGELVRKGWRGITTVGAQNLAVFEIFE